MNRQGSAILSVLFVIAIVTYIAMRAMEVVGPLQSLRQQEALQDAREAFATSMKMLYRIQGVAMNTLFKPDVLGTSLNEFATKTKNKALKLPFPSLDGDPSPFTFEPGAEYQGLVVTNVSWQDPLIVGDKTYLIDLIIGFEPKTGGPAMSAIIPFYVTTDAGGSVTKAYATSYSKTGVTSEDQVCVLTEGEGTYYDPASYVCKKGERKAAGGTR